MPTILTQTQADRAGSDHNLPDLRATLLELGVDEEEEGRRLEEEQEEEEKDAWEGEGRELHMDRYVGFGFRVCGSALRWWGLW